MSRLHKCRGYKFGLLNLVCTEEDNEFMDFSNELFQYVKEL